MLVVYFRCNHKTTNPNLCALQHVVIIMACVESFFFFLTINEQQQSALEDYVETALIVISKEPGYEARHNRDK